jgi:uncharacterized membrane protein
MPTSIYLAKLIGPVMLAVGMGVFVNSAVYRALADEFLRSRALIGVSGLLLMTTGMAVVLAHNVWVANWPVLITLLGWVAAVAGAVRIVIPQGTERIGRVVHKSKMGLQIAGGTWVALGALFCVFGYFR